MSASSAQLMTEIQSEADLHQLLVPSPYDAPSVPPKDTPPSRSDSNADSYFVPDSLSRTTSIFSFSRASFSSQLASLTSMTLPEAESLAAGIASLPTAPKAVRALNQAAEQIQTWTRKAVKVLKNLDADDDVEWAAAAGREGLDEVDKCVADFEHLISVYVLAIEELQSREDIADVRSEELETVVEQMEVTLDGWDSVKTSLKSTHDQVELAMEFQELWGEVLGDVGNELDNLSGLVFEMEERRHMALQTPIQNVGHQTVDLNELENALGDTAAVRKTPNSRFSLPPAFESSPLGSPIIENPQDDSDLLALFARMQPLKASLDFLPMRLSIFNSRAEKVFPHACEEVKEKRARLETNWEQLQKDAENLRRELSEDRWVVVFRNAGRQAKKMCESVERSVAKVQEAVDGGYQRTNPSALAKRVESFEAKKMHYGPAVQRVLAIIQKGLKERLTINGEILRLHKDMSTRAREMVESMDDMEMLLESMNANHNSRLRESISSIVSADRSFSSTTFVDTPGSSPASSVDLPSQRHEPPKSKYGLNGYSKPRALSSSRPPMMSSRRSSVLPQPRRPTTPLSSHSTSTLPRRAISPSPALPSVYRQGIYTPPVAPAPRPAPTPLINKPRWSSTVNPSAVTTPSGYSRTTPRSISTTSSIPHPSPLSREASSSPTLPTPVTARRGSQQFRSFAERVASPTPGRNGSILDPVPYHRGRNATAPAAGTIRSPSALAMPSNSRPNVLPARPPSRLNRMYTPPSKQPHVIPTRTSSAMPRIQQSQPQAQEHPPIPSQGREDRTIDLDADHENQDLDFEDDDQVPDPEPSSSPLARMKTSTPTARPGSVMSAGSRGKRMSMLPVPAGRTSSLGHHKMGS